MNGKYLFKARKKLVLISDVNFNISKLKFKRFIFMSKLHEFSVVKLLELVSVLTYFSFYKWWNYFVTQHFTSRRTRYAMTCQQPVPLDAQHSTQTHISTPPTSISISCLLIWLPGNFQCHRGCYVDGKLSASVALDRCCFNYHQEIKVKKWKAATKFQYLLTLQRSKKFKLSNSNWTNRI